MTILKLGAVALVMATALVGCDDKKAPATDKPTTDKPAADEAADDKQAKAEKKKDEKAEEKADDDAAEEGAGDAITVSDLAEKFKADEKALIGKEVTVNGAFMNANYVKSGGEEQLNNIVLIPKKGESKPSITCETKDKAAIEGLKQYDEIKVTGKVRKRFSDPSLEDCKVSR